MQNHSAYSNSSSLAYPEMDYADNKLKEMLNISDLFQVLFKRLHQLYSVDCAVLVLYDQELTKIVNSYTSYLSEGNDMVTETFPAQVPFCMILECIARLEFPILKTKEEWVEQFHKNHCLLNGDSSFQYHCYIPLESNNRVIGTIELHNHYQALSTECLSYSTSITDLLADCIAKANDKQLSIALANSTAQETIELQRAEINSYKQQLEEQKLYLPEEVYTPNNYPEIIGNGDKMQAVFTLLGQVAGMDTTVLILGETGTGKELIARAIHDSSSRKNKVMVKVNCAAIPANLIESELFGHEKGSFTGATERRLGKFELANNSTLFLDEVGELPLELQVKLLRVLQEKEIERVGGKTIISTNVRIVSATNRNLLKEVEAGRFRLDLFYRLNVFPIILPSLRNRREDIPLLASHFLSQFNSKAGKCLEGFSQKVLQDMMRYDWPGNVRELEHLIERQVLLTKGKMIKSIDLPTAGRDLSLQNDDEMIVKTIYENERDHIFAVLKKCKGKVSGEDGAAKLLGVPSTTLSSKIKRFALSKKHII